MLEDLVLYFKLMRTTDKDFLKEGSKKNIVLDTGRYARNEKHK